MEEKVICSSSNKGDKIKLIIAVCFLVIAAVLFLMYYPKYSAALDDISLYWRAYYSNEDLYKMGSELAISPIEYNRENKEFYDDMHARKSEALSFLYIAVGCAVIASISLYKWLYYGRTTITVTDKRIYGKAAFGKEVDLPLSNIVMLHKRGKKNMIIATSAGKVRFVGVKNRNEIYGAIQTLMAVK